MKEKEFKISELFEPQNGDFDIQQTHINNKGIFVVSSGETNTGIIGKTDIKAKIFKSNTITVDMFGYVYFRNHEYKMVTHARVFSLSFKEKELSVEEGLYFIAQLQFLKKFYSYSNMASWKKIQHEKIFLPITKNGKIDFGYMTARIRELQTARIRELNTYLRVTGLGDHILTTEEQVVLKKFRERGKNKFV